MHVLDLLQLLQLQARQEDPSVLNSLHVLDLQQVLQVRKNADGSMQTGRLSLRLSCVIRLAIPAPHLLDPYYAYYPLLPRKMADKEADNLNFLSQPDTLNRRCCNNGAALRSTVILLKNRMGSNETRP